MASWEAYDNQVLADMEAWVDEYVQGPEGLYMLWMLGANGFGDAVRQVARKIREICSVSQDVTGFGEGDGLGYYESEDEARKMVSAHMDCLRECAPYFSAGKTDSDALDGLLDEGWAWCDVLLRQESVRHNSLLLARRICDRMTDRFGLSHEASSVNRYATACRIVMSAWIGEADYTVEYSLGKGVATDRRHYKTMSELISMVLTIGCDAFICIDPDDAAPCGVGLQKEHECMMR